MNAINTLNIDTSINGLRLTDIKLCAAERETGMHARLDFDLEVAGKYRSNTLEWLDADGDLESEGAHHDDHPEEIHKAAEALGADRSEAYRAVREALLAAVAHFEDDIVKLRDEDMLRVRWDEDDAA